MDVKCFLILLSSILWCAAQGDSDGNKDETSILDLDSEEKFNEENIKQKPNSTSGNMNIPSYYNKLEIPVFSKSKLAAEMSPEDMAANDMFDKLRIEVGVYIRGIGDVDELEEEMTIEMDFVAMWVDHILLVENVLNSNDETSGTDEGLIKSLKALDPAFLNQIWKPDLFIENVVSYKRPSIMVKPIKLLFSKEGLIVFSTRLTATIDCEMEFYYYPADTQKCDFKIRSYSHKIDELILAWKKPHGVYISDRNEHNFDIQVTNVTKYTITEAEGLIGEDYSETYDVLQFTILARRSLSYHMIQTYLPSMFFIVITWLCFLIPVAMVEARIGVAMTTLLTLTSMFSSVRESTPIVSYIKAIDIWMVACIFFVFSTLLEFTVLVFMRHSGEGEEGESQPENNEQNENDVTEVEAEDQKAPPLSFNDSFFVRLRKFRKRTETVSSKTRRERKKTALWIERHAFLVFFLTFLAFNIVYWPWLLVASDYFEWNVDKKYNEL